MNERIDFMCHEALRIMWDYLDGEIDVALALRVDFHLEICPGCRRQFASERRFLDALSRAAPLDADVSALRERVLEALAAAGMRRATPPRWRLSRIL